MPAVAFHQCLALLLALSSPQDEGPLNNDTFQPRSEEAQSELLVGDRAWARALDGGADATQRRVDAFEAWRRALDASSAGDAVLLHDQDGVAQGLWPDPDNNHKRRAESVPGAVLRRLMSLTPDDRSVWTARFSGMADQLLASGPYAPELLRRVERDLPLTRAAAIAALRLADTALESGSPDIARTWLSRAAVHGSQAGVQWEDALDLRRTLAASQDPIPQPELWREANSLHLMRADRLESGRRLGRDLRPIPLGRGLEPGLAFLDSGAVVVQTAHALIWLDPSAARTDVGLVARLPVTEIFSFESLRTFASPSSGGWVLRPATDGRDLVVINDRGRNGRVIRDFGVPAKGNHLACLRYGLDGRPQVRWELSDRGLQRPGGETRDVVDVLGVQGHFEFQPGPVVHEGMVYVQARRLPDPTEEGALRGGDLWLFALSLASGEARWHRFLTSAADLRQDLGRGGGIRSEVGTTGMPLTLTDGVLVVGTNVGLVIAVEIADGRLVWSLRTQRRQADEAGWPGSRAPLVAQLTEGTAAVVAPFDSRFLYTLALRPSQEGGLWGHPPQALGSLLDVVASRGNEMVFLGLDGRHGAMRFRRGESGLRSSLYLDEGERFSGRALTSELRVLVASDRAVYLLDRDRDQFLIDAVPLPGLGAGVGGSVLARDDRVYVVGRETLWVLEARR
jgi:outer membrane protein assembly factor BamB